MKIIYLMLLACLLNASTIKFSDEEKNFIKNHPVIKVGIDLKLHTIDAIDWDGDHVGISSDYLKIIAKQSGLKFDLKVLDTLQEIKDKKIDMVASIYKTAQRSKYLIYTDPYISVPFYIYTKEDHPTIANLNSLNGSEVCVLKGFMTVTWLEQNYPNIRVVEANTIYDALEKVYKNEVAAFINDFPSTNYVLQNVFLPNMKLNSPVVQLSNVPIMMGVRSDYEILGNIINKINANLSESDVEKLREKWFIKGKIAMLNFSKKERIWIEKHKEIKFSADPDWLPFEAYSHDTAQYYGITNDILTIVSNRTGIKFKLLEANTWEEAQQQIKDDKSQMLPTVTSSYEFKDYLNFSKPFMNLAYVIYGLEDGFKPDSLKELKDKKVAILKDSSAYEDIKTRYPDITFIAVEDTQSLITLLIKDKVDYFISNQASASYIINSGNFTNVVGILELDISYSPRVAISKDLGLVGISVLDKVIDSISEEEMENIYDKWIFVKANENRANKIPVIIYVVFISIFLATLFLLWKNYLSNRRTK